MNYGFVINNNRCIGCHACSTACKSENEVPLGVHRTWVKYVERGTYPDAQRSFLVTRCNHCENPPCARICPVTAMYQRDDGIVEFDPDQCIGCKACMQACPYDAIHVDPETNTVAKCHYCAHRVDVGLEPACVVVCPTHAIIAGDMDDPDSEIFHTMTSNQTSVRKPEQGTRPKLHYINANDLALTPTSTAEAPDGMLWSDVVTEQGMNDLHAHGNGNGSGGDADLIKLLKAPSGATIRQPQEQGMPRGGPIKIGGGTTADHMVQIAWNAQHKIPWHWPVPAYLVTKGIGAGIFLFLALGWALGWFGFDQNAMVWGGLFSLIATVATTGLLVIDLERPERFLRIVLRPQWNSWLARGAFLLIGFSTVSGLWWVAEAAGWLGWFEVPDIGRQVAGWLTIPLAIGAAVYTAFLFAQAEGRDLWQSALLPIHLVIQALMLGSGSLLLVHAVAPMGADLVDAARVMFIGMLITDLFVTLFGEFGIPHASEVAARAAHQISHGKYKNSFWFGSIVGGHVVPLVLLFAGNAMLAAVAAVFTYVGLYLYEHAFVMAPQEVPNS
jgi:Fe-S-cluster-containing dehydrogenase component/formate-dependent nitrite reductase membrane component NrfD